MWPARGLPSACSSSWPTRRPLPPRTPPRPRWRWPLFTAVFTAADGFSSYCSPRTCRSPTCLLPPPSPSLSTAVPLRFPVSLGTTGPSGLWKFGFRPVVRRGQTVVVSYTDPTSGDDANAIQDTAGNDVASFTTGSGGVPAVINESSVSPTATVPGAPTALGASAYGTTTIDLSWSAPDDNGGSAITGYKIEVSSDGGSNWTTRGAATYRTRTIYRHTGVPKGTTRHYRVSAINPVGTGLPSNVAATTTPGAPTVDPPPPPPPGPRQTVPGAPRNLLADGTDGAVTLSWDAPENDDGSEITDYEYRIDRRNPWISIGSTDTTHTVTGLDNGTAYTFEVAGGQQSRQGLFFHPGRGHAGSAGSVYPGLCAFRQRDRHHLRLRVRECVPPSDPARPLLLRSGGPSH